MNRKTYQAKPNDVPREWVVVDLDGTGGAAWAVVH